MKIKISKHGYQRNGISGEGFFYFLFTSLESRYDRDLIVQKEIQMIATLTVENENPEEFNGSCRVITPDNLALQGGVDFDFGNGFYIGNWNSTGRFGEANLEINLLS